MKEQYARNIPAVSPQEQDALSRAHICIAGCGGIGGYLAEYLTRLGVGSLTLIDGDTFESSNLNRQLPATQHTLGQNKAEAARERILSISPEFSVTAYPTFLTPENAPALLQGSDLVMDALDSPDARLALAAACKALGVPLIHGSVSGWQAQIAVCMPSGHTMEQLYQGDPPAGDPSCLSFTPALCAAIQCAEAVKLLTGHQPALAGKLLICDLRDMHFDEIPVN